MPDFYREIDDVVEAVWNARAREKKCALLVGAGCSVTAGIPSAAGFVDVIRTDWKSAYRRAAQNAAPNAPTYPQCMAMLTDAERRDLIAKKVNRASINWAHLAIAQLMKDGFVDRVYTTNFDPLVLRACAMLNVFPAVYDFAASQRFKPAYLPERAVFHLHGQHTGFVLLHTKEQVEKLSASIEPLFEDAMLKRLWLVVGYSGEQDPVFEHLARMDRSDERLYWVGYRDNEPAPHVRDRLLGEEKFSFFVKGHDADDFFVLLAQGLGCFPPAFVQKPFSHLSEMLDTLTQYNMPGRSTQIEIRETARILIGRAIEELEKGAEGKTLLAESHLMAGRFDDVLQLASEDMPARLADAVSWAYTMQGNALGDQAKLKEGAQADTLFAEACAKYGEALKVKPDRDGAQFNWGITLYDQAGMKSGSEADALYAGAAERFSAALEISPSRSDVLHMWGRALAHRAKLRTGADADTFFEAAQEKFATALKIKPDELDALNNWGILLLDQARSKSGAEANALFAAAGQKFATVVGAKPDHSQALYNWGKALADQARTRTGAEAEALFAAAGEKYAAAVRVKPDDDEALNNWGNALSDLALFKTGAEADALFEQSYEKYAAAMKISPRDHGTLHNWGIAISDQARTKTGAEVDTLLASAREKFEASLQIEPGSAGTLSRLGTLLLNQARRKGVGPSSDLLGAAWEKLSAAESLSTGLGAYPLACISALRGDGDACRKWLETCRSLGNLPSREQLLAEPDLAGVLTAPWFQEHISEAPASAPPPA